jgi:hypothetical protein
MKITFEQVGDYLFPETIQREAPCEVTPPLGRYGQMHKEFLRKHRPTLYRELLQSERLYPICQEIDESAEHRMNVITDREVAHEIILTELVYA